MANLVVGDRVLVTIVGTLLGQRTMNTFPYRVSTAMGDVDYEAAMAGLLTKLVAAGELVDAYKDCVPENWEPFQIWAQAIKPVRRRKVSISGGVPTGFGGDALTANVSASITRIGPDAGRRDIGGIRVPISPSDTNIGNGFLKLGLENRLQVLADEMAIPIIVGIPSFTLLPQVGMPNGNLASFDLVDTAVQDTVRVVRRRTVGRGI